MDKTSGYLTWEDVSERTFVVERDFTIRIQFHLEQGQHCKDRRAFTVACRAYAVGGESPGHVVCVQSCGFPSHRAKTMPALFERLLYDLERTLIERQNEAKAAKQTRLPL